MAHYLDYDGLLYFWTKIKTIFATKSEVNTGLGNKVSKSGDTITGDLIMGSSTNTAGIKFAGGSVGIYGTGNRTVKIANLATPTNNYDAAPKDYVDTQDAALESDLKDYVDEKIPEAQIQSDWSQTDTTKKDYIKNKPTIPAAQVNSDWNATSGKAQILNKPTKLSDFTDDVVDGNYVKKTGETMSGILEFSGTNSGITFYSGNSKGIVGATSSQTGAGLTIVSNIRTPVNDYDAATKKYVDDLETSISSTYETSSHASSTYETKANASSTYETKINASKTYETKTHASSTYALKSEIPTGAYIYKGSVATESNLPLTGNKLGDVYNVEADGSNYAWKSSSATGTLSDWDRLGGTFSITSITNTEIDTIVAT